jgi:soluble lytic murein transglycosylase-like protein
MEPVTRSVGKLALAAIALAALPAAAQADVLEIGAQGPTWIAGGPVEAMPEVVAGEVPVIPEPEAAEAVSLAHSTRAMTQVAAAAGPDQWRARVAELAAKYDISPTLLEAVVWQESRWNPNAVSPVGARGLAQLMPGTAKMMGVNPNDPYANLEGGAKYLRLQLDAFKGNVEFALAAYNAGPGRVIQYGGIPPIPETQKYVAAIMARLTEPVRK